MNRSYYIISVNKQSQTTDNDYDIAYEAIDEGIPSYFQNSFFGYDLSSFRIIIFKINEINVVNNNPERVEFIPLVGFSGSNINLSEVKEQFKLALSGKLDALGNAKKVRRINSEKTGENKTTEEPSKGGNVGLPFGLPGYIFPFPGIPPIIFLILTGISAYKLAGTRNPIWAGVGAYTYIHYLKNKKK